MSLSKMIRLALVAWGKEQSNHLRIEASTATPQPQRKRQEHVTVLKHIAGMPTAKH